ncbi:MAG: class I tRNA ligase family protein [Anaerolineales bacterium]|nr:class I tRNA ligase family protein [Anaerolineales bacterium]
MTYGTGAIMAVPSHDERDFAFALKFGLPIIPVIARPDGAARSCVAPGTMQAGFAQALSEAGISFEERDGALCVALSQEQATRYIEIARAHIQPGGWTEVVGSEWVFIFADEVLSLDSAAADAAILVRRQALEPELRDKRTVMEMLWAVPFYRDVLFHAERGAMIHSEAFSGTPGDCAAQQVTQWLEEQGKGEFAVNYRLRDWLISRQRYWGAPIPIVYCGQCGAVPIPYEDLPVLLPEDAEFAPTGESPLKYHAGFLNTTCPRCGGPATRETDTMDTFVCSSWYHYAYLSPYYRADEPAHRDSTPIDPAEADYWLPVDVYTGGIEHATMHLIYTRFFTKAMRDMGLVAFDEPMTMLHNQGTILGEDGEKMSKSRGNVIAPDALVARYGADTVRGYLMFGWRWEQGGPWDPNGIEGIARWLNRVWNLVLEPGDAGGAATEEEVAYLRRSTHKTIRRVTDDIEAFAFNTTIAGLMEYTNVLMKARQTGLYGTPAWDEAVETLLLLLTPCCPHISEELWARLGKPYSVHQQAWPKFDPDLAADEVITLILQINGKVRSKLEAPAGISEEQAREAALADERMQRFIGDAKPRKVIYVPGRQVNVVL